MLALALGSLSKRVNLKLSLGTLHQLISSLNDSHKTGLINSVIFADGNYELLQMYRTFGNS